MARVTATIEVIDTDIDLEVDDDASFSEIEAAIWEYVTERINILNWEKVNDED